jgi:dTMP kinase
MKILKNFIVFEGLDGAGTTTQSKLLEGYVKNSFLTCEPTGGDFGRMIRKILQKDVKASPLSLAYLFAADRAEHLYGDDGIVKKCDEGKTVISDRYFFSSLAYQSLDVAFEKVLEINRDFPLPEILFFIDTPIAVCQDRIKKRSAKIEIFEDDILQEQILSNYKKGILNFEGQGMKTYYLKGELPVEKLFEEEKSILEREGLCQQFDF